MQFMTMAQESPIETFPAKRIKDRPFDNNTSRIVFADHLQEEFQEYYETAGFPE